MKKWVHIVLVIIAIAGGFEVYFSTTLGPSVSSDSVGYMMGAKNLLSGHGLSLISPNGVYRPITLHPPLYPLSLAFMDILGFSNINGARWLSIILMITTVFILGFGLYGLSSSPILAITSALAIIFSPAIQGVYYLAMSDALALLLTVSALLFLISLIRKPSLLLLIVFSILSALLILTRYSDLAILPTGFLLLLIIGVDSWSKRIKYSLGYVGLVSTLILPWMIYTYISTGALAGREPANISGYWSALAPFRGKLISNIWQWLPFNQTIPIDAYRLKLFLFTILVLAIFVLSVILIFRKQKTDNSFTMRVALIPFVFLSYAGLFVIAFIAAYLLTTPTPDVNSRTLIPLFTTLILAFFSTLWLWAHAWDGQRASWLKLLPVLFCALILADYVPTSLRLITNKHTNSDRNCANPEWQNSEIVPAIMKLPLSTPIIASEEACIYLYTGRRPYDLRNIRISNIQNITPFGNDLSDPLQVQFRDQNAALVISDGFEYYLESKYFVNAGTIIQSLTSGLISYHYHDGSIYFYP